MGERRSDTSSDQVSGAEGTAHATVWSARHQNEPRADALIVEDYRLNRDLPLASGTGRTANAIALHAWQHTYHRRH